MSDKIVNRADGTRDSPSHRARILAWMDATSIPEPLREDLLRYLTADSRERARLISGLATRNPGIADVLIGLEADDQLRTRFEQELIRAAEPTAVSEVAEPAEVLRVGVKDGKRGVWSCVWRIWTHGDDIYVAYCPLRDEVQPFTPRVAGGSPTWITPETASCQIAPGLGGARPRSAPYGANPKRGGGLACEGEGGGRVSRMGYSQRSPGRELPRSCSPGCGRSTCLASNHHGRCLRHPMTPPRPDEQTHDLRTREPRSDEDHPSRFPRRRYPDGCPGIATDAPCSCIAGCGHEACRVRAWR